MAQPLLFSWRCRRFEAAIVGGACAVSTALTHMCRHKQRQSFFGSCASADVAALEMRHVMRLRLQAASFCMPCVSLGHGRYPWALTASAVFGVSVRAQEVQQEGGVRLTQQLGRVPYAGLYEPRARLPGSTAAQVVCPPPALWVRIGVAEPVQRWETGQLALAQRLALCAARLSARWQPREGKRLHVVAAAVTAFTVLRHLQAKASRLQSDMHLELPDNSTFEETLPGSFFRMSGFGR